MKSISICLDTIDKVRSFVNVVSRRDGDFDLVSERYVIDAKSIMGIFSLDLSKPLRLDIHNVENYDEVAAELKPFIV